MSMGESKPFLRWAGSKRKLVPELRTFLPEDLINRGYREPFLGAGSLFFAVGPSDAVLSDANHHLIACYRHVRDNPSLVNTYLRRHAGMTSKDYYYKVRSQYNRLGNSAAQAARFIYLNKTCFNGIFRVNKKDDFNVPYGFKEPPSLPSLDQLFIASRKLRNTQLDVASFEVALESSSSTDFIYLDPPYPPLNGTSFFTHYTPERFGFQQHAALARIVRDLDKIGAEIMITNADTPWIRGLYGGFRFNTLSVRRWISCKKIKHCVSELVITNY